MAGIYSTTNNKSFITRVKCDNRFEAHDLPDFRSRTHIVPLADQLNQRDKEMKVSELLNGCV